MKRGWISWDQNELPRAAFEARLDALRRHLRERELPAAVIYSDIWRSNRARHFSNFMPYWNRALLVVPRDAPPILLSGLTPRVYPWIRNVTILDEIRPSLNLARQLLVSSILRDFPSIYTSRSATQVSKRLTSHSLLTPIRGRSRCIATRRE